MKKLILYINFQLDSIWKILDLNCSNDLYSLAIVRIITGYFLLIFLLPHYSWIGTVPQGLFNPPKISLSNLFNTFPNVLVFNTIDIINPLLVTCFTLGIKSRISGVLIFLINIFALNFAYSFGKINHSILIWSQILIMSFSGWGTKYALLPDKPLKFENHNRALSILGVLICFGFFSAGFSKLLHWIDFDLSTSGVLSWHFLGYFSYGRTALLAPLMNRLPLYVTELMDYIAPLFEVSGFIFILLGAFYWRIWLLMAAIFHLTNNLILNIKFIANIPVLLTFVNFSIYFGYIGSKLNLNFQKIRYVLIFTVIYFTLELLFYRISGRDSTSLLVHYISLFVDKNRPITLYLSVFFWCITILILINNIIYHYTKRTQYELLKSEILNEEKSY